MIGIPSLVAFVGGMVKEGFGLWVDTKKHQTELKIEKEAEIKRKEVEKEILQIQLQLQQAGVDIATQNRIVAEKHSEAEIIKSNNDVEKQIISLRAEEINTSHLDYLKDENGVARMNGFWAGFCNLLICITNCFKTVPLFTITTLIGFAIVVMLIKNQVSVLEGNPLFMGLVGLLEIVVSYFTGRKVSSNISQYQKKNS